MRSILRRTALLGALVFAAALLSPVGAGAGVATSGAVLLDPFDPVPEIQFHHFGGYGGGCGYGCGRDDGYDRCGGGCARRHHRHHHDDCDDGCGVRYDHHDGDDDDRGGRDDRDRHDGHDGPDGHDGHDGRPDAAAPPCATPRCYDAEHYEHRWRDGDRVGQDWYDRGHRERVLPDDKHSHNWYGHGSDNDWRDDDDDGGDPPPPPPPPGPPPHH